MPLLYLPVILITSGPSAIFSEWIISILLKKILMSICFGVLFGLTANRMLKYSQYHNLIDKQSFIAFSLALSVIILHGKINSNTLAAYNDYNEHDRL